MNIGHNLTNFKKGTKKCKHFSWTTRHKYEQTQPPTHAPTCTHTTHTAHTHTHRGLSKVCVCLEVVSVAWGSSCCAAGPSAHREECDLTSFLGQSAAPRPPPSATGRRSLLILQGVPLKPRLRRPDRWTLDPSHLWFPSGQTHYRSINIYEGRVSLRQSHN